MASAGVCTFSPASSINPWRSTTVPLAITGPLTVTILALRMATGGGGCWARARAPPASSAITSFSIKTVIDEGVGQSGEVTEPAGVPRPPLRSAEVWMKYICFRFRALHRAHLRGWPRKEAVANESLGPSRPRTVESGSPEQPHVQKRPADL